MMSMPEMSNGQLSSAVEKRLEEGDHAQQKAGMEAASPRRYLMASPLLTAPSTARVNVPFTSSSASTCAPGRLAYRLAVRPAQRGQSE